LRTEVAKTNPQPELAEELIRLMGVAHGIQNWETIESYDVDFTDEFYGIVGKFSHRFGAAKNEFSLSYIPNTYDGIMKFKNGPNNGKTWGIQSWKTYKQLSSGAPVFKSHFQTYFWVPTYQYFVEFPLRIQKADAFAYAGEKVINGITCVGVVASWKTTEAQRDIDQYLVWLDKSSKRMVRLEYTVREMYNFLTGAANISDSKKFEGILFPGTMEVESNIVLKGLLHTMTINKVAKSNLPLNRFRPDSSLPVLGDDKE